LKCCHCFALLAMTKVVSSVSATAVRLQARYGSGGRSADFA
jgi:hypothetical protein